MIAAIQTRWSALFYVKCFGALIPCELHPVCCGAKERIHSGEGKSTIESQYKDMENWAMGSSRRCSSSLSLSISCWCCSFRLFANSKLEPSEHYNGNAEKVELWNSKRCAASCSRLPTKFTQSKMLETHTHANTHLHTFWKNYRHQVIRAHTIKTRKKKKIAAKQQCRSKE